MKLIFYILLLSHFAIAAAWTQLVPEPLYLFEELSWGDKPNDLTWHAGVLWDRRSDTITASQFKTGLTDIFEMRGQMPFEDKNLGILCEFFRSDSGLGALMVNMSRLSLPFGPDLDSLLFDEEMMDLMWDENVERFGEPTRKRWIPFVVSSREWVLESVTIRMVRIHTPFEGFVMSYFRNNSERGE